MSDFKPFQLVLSDTKGIQGFDTKYAARQKVEQLFSSKGLINDSRRVIVESNWVNGIASDTYTAENGVVATIVKP